MVYTYTSIYMYIMCVWGWGFVRSIFWQTGYTRKTISA